MTALEALQAARAAGIVVALNGDDLVLEALSRPPEPLLDALSENKAGIVALFLRSNGGWSAEDWYALFDERAGIAEFDGGLERKKAEDLAFASCIAEWLNRNPVRSPPAKCLGCGQQERAHDLVVPFGSDINGHAWLHQRCWNTWHEGRKADAAAALVAMGIVKGKSTHDEKKAHK